MSNEVEKILAEDNVAPAETAAASNDEAAAKPDNELNEPRWAVIGAGDRTVRHLTYEQAIECRNVLDAEGIFGLVIVTDETAERVLADQGQS
ncbi:MAG TPA: hypothetical protein VGO50_04475 [Pyrinomonadaceae bacterium]|nr:hypothetical protein [Pyrinomonadaceae bacterium]